MADQAPQFLDEKGNPIEAPMYLDAAGNPVTPRQAQPPARSRTWTDTAKDVGIGALKGATHTALDAGSLMRSIPLQMGASSPNVGTVTDAIGNTMGRLAGRARYGTSAEPVKGDAAIQQARDETQYTNAPQMVGGGLETAAEMAVPVTSAVKAIPSTERAGKAFQSVMGAAANTPVDVNAAGQVALRVQELADRGASMPMVARKFLQRITSPKGGPMTYQEARDFASNVSRVSANEYARMTPVVAKEMAELRVTLNKAVADAAQAAGKGEEYAAAMKEYANAKKIQGVLSDVWAGTKRAFPYAGGAGAGLYLAQKLKDVLSGPQ